LPYDMVWAERRVKEIQNHTGISPGEKVSNKSEMKDVYVNVANEMDHVMKMVKGLVHHVGLEPDVDADGLGRFYNKSKEEMPSVDMKDKQRYMFTIIGIGAVCFGFFMWAIGVLFRTGSVATKGLAGYLLGMFGVFVLLRVYAKLAGNGSALSEAAYIDQQLKKMYREIYTAKMAQLKVDVLKLVVETSMPTSEDDGNEKLVMAATRDDDTNNYRDDVESRTAES
jgi:hypothetical protein